MDPLASSFDPTAGAFSPAGVSGSSRPSATCEEVRTMRNKDI
jgi:hypothetical protein